MIELHVAVPGLAVPAATGFGFMAALDERTPASSDPHNVIGGKRS